MLHPPACACGQPASVSCAQSPSCDRAGLGRGRADPQLLAQSLHRVSSQPHRCSRSSMIPDHPRLPRPATDACACGPDDRPKCQHQAKCLIGKHLQCNRASLQRHAENCKLLAERQVRGGDHGARQEKRPEQEEDNAYDAHCHPSTWALGGGIVADRAGKGEARKSLCCNEYGLSGRDSSAIAYLISSRASSALASRARRSSSLS